MTNNITVSYGIIEKNLLDKVTDIFKYFFPKKELSFYENYFIKKL